MADWYCDYATGNDSTGSGASGSPYQTIQKCIDSATRGDTIYVANTSAQVFSSALSFGTGYTSIGSGETLITGWDNGGSLSLTVPGTTGTIPAGKIDATGLTVDWLTSIQPYVTVSDMIIDCGTSFNGTSTSNYWNFFRCHFLTTVKTSGYAVANVRRLVACTFEGFGTQNANNVINCFFKDVATYAVYNGGHKLIGNLFLGEATYTGSSPLVDPTGSSPVIANNTFISPSARTGPLLLLSSDQAVINNVFQGANGVGGSGIDANSQHHLLANNIFYDCTSNTVNDSLVRNYSPSITASSAPYADAGTNQWEASSEVASKSYPTGFISSDTQTYKDAGAIEQNATGGTSYTNVASAKFTRLE